ncbi:MAG: FixH family protein [Caldilineaceae bacterium]|nr:FixH family protein [Caldilineaceae bacterium]
MAEKKEVRLMKRQRLIQWLCVLSLAFITACGATSQGGENPNVQITLLPVEQGAATTALAIQLQNAADEAITDASVSVEGNMNHAGMAPVFTDTITDVADGTADGIYQVPFQFSMLGDWIITVSVTLADGSQVTKDINLTVTNAGVQQP